MDDGLDIVFKALADPTRRRILDLLRAGPRTTGDLAGEFESSKARGGRTGVSRFAVMKHLRVLERAGLVVVQRQGRERYNFLNAVPLRQMYERWVSAYADLWATALVNLKRIVEEKRDPGELNDR